MINKILIIKALKGGSHIPQNFLILRLVYEWSRIVYILIRTLNLQLPITTAILSPISTTIAAISSSVAKFANCNSRKSQSLMVSNRGRGGHRSWGGSRTRSHSRVDGHYPLSIQYHSTSPSDDEDDTSDHPLQEVSADDMTTETDDSADDKKELIPGELWFTKSDVVRAVTKSIKKHYKKPWRNWTETPNEVKDRWFNYFKRFFTWRPELDMEVRASYYEKAGKRLKDMVHDAARKKPDQKPNWMSTKVHRELLKRNEEDGFQKRSMQAKKNKRGGSDTNLVRPGHCQGSISTAEVADRLAKENGGVFPTAVEVYIRTHSREEKGKGKVLFGEKPKKTVEEYNRKMAEYKEKGINKDPNEVFWEVVGGRKKGVVQGLGSSTDLFYKKSSGRTTPICNSIGSFAPSLISQLSTQVQEAKKVAEETSRAYDNQIAEFERQKVEFERQRADLERERVQLERERVQAERDRVNEQKRFNEYLFEMQKSQKQMNDFCLLIASRTLQSEPHSHPSASQQQPLGLPEVGEKEKSSGSALPNVPNQTRKNKKRCRN